MKYLLILILSISAFSQEKQIKYRQKNLITNGEIHTNNVKAIIANNGWLFWGGGASGFINPSPVFSHNDGNFATIFAGGLWIVGTVNGEKRAAIANYATDFIPGDWDEYKNDPVLNDQANPKYIIYYHYSDGHIDYLESLLEDYDSAESSKIVGFAVAELEKAQLSNLNWQEAINQGAPEHPPGDIAAFAIYHDAHAPQREDNGLNESKTPMNIQVRQLLYSYRAENALNNTVFAKFDLINKNAVPITNFGISVWADPDVGQYQDDLIGSDRDLELAFAYNGHESDAQYTDVLNLQPPAVAYNFVQGFLVDSAGENVISRGDDFEFLSNENNENILSYDDKLIIDKTLTSAFGIYYFDGGEEADNAEQYYNMHQSRFAYTGALSQAQSNYLSQNPGLDTSVVNWMFSGDPERGTGWLDQNPNDRRFIYNTQIIELGVSNGLEGFENPAYNSFTVAVTNSFGGSNLNSVTRLKFDSKLVDFEFQNAFKGLDKPIVPKVYAYAEDQKIALHWESQFDEETGFTTESFRHYNYEFQGYQIAEFNAKGEFKNIEIIDRQDGIKNFSNLVQDSITKYSKFERYGTGLDDGIRHNTEITSSLFSGVTLYNNNEYQFAVRSLNYSAKPYDGATQIIFSDWAKIKVRPRKLQLGSEIISERLQSVDYQFVGDIKSGGEADISVVDPYKTTSSSYQIKFKKTTTRRYHFGYSYSESRDNNWYEETYYDSIPKGTLVWYLEKDGQKVSITVNGEETADWIYPILIADAPNWWSRPTTDNNFSFELYYDGLKVSVSDNPKNFKDFTVIANRNGVLDPPDMAGFAFNGLGFPLVNGADRPDGSRQQTNGSTWGIHISNDWTAGNSFADFIGDVGYYMGGINGPLVAGAASGTGIHHAIPNDYEIRFTAASSKAVLRDGNTANRHMIDVPFELWNTGPVASDTSDDYRMVPFIRDRDGDLLFSFSGDDHSVSGGTNDPVLEGITFLDPTDKTPGQAGYDALVAAATADLAATGNMDASITAFPYAYNSTYHTVGFNYIGLVNWNGGDVGDAAFPANVDALMPEEGTIFRISMNKINTENTVMEFKGPGAPTLNNPDLASQDFAKNLTVFPNPLYGFNTQGSGSDLYVTFANLPVIENKDEVTIDIFTMNGDVINRLVYDGQSTEFRWDLKNKYGTQVGNGLYIASLTYRGKNVIKKILIFKGKSR